jgi:hypothetical protein
MTRPPQRKRGQGRKSKPKQVRPRPNENADPKVGKRGAKRKSARAPRVQRPQSATTRTQVELGRRNAAKTIPGPSLRLPLLPNEHDNAVIRRLSTASLGSLPVDQFSRLLRKDGRGDDRQTIATLRSMLIRVYFLAADTRHRARAAQWQIDLAQRALASVKTAVTGLGEVRPKRQRGVSGSFGSPLDDIKGADELNEFVSSCWQLQLDLVPIAQALDHLITAEITKPRSSGRGERKKRLRILVEELAKWWSSATKRSIAPYVWAKRLDHAPAIVVARSGEFVELAQALFYEVDEFTPSEVISAITNVHESQAQK